MKHLLLTTIAAMLLVGCGEAQPPEPSTLKAPSISTPNISIHDAAAKGNIDAVKHHLATGADVNAKGYRGFTLLHYAARNGHKEIVELLIAEGADVNAKMEDGWTPLDMAIGLEQPETVALLRKHGGKTGEELKAEGK